MKIYLFLLLMLAATISCKNHSNFASNAKLLLVEEAYLCEECKTFQANDTMKVIRYRYDNRNRLVFTITKNIQTKFTDSSRYYYNNKDELIRLESFLDGDPKPEITRYYYDKGIPVYSSINNDTSVRDRDYYTVKNHKIIKIAAAQGKLNYTINYIGNETVIYSTTDATLLSIDTDKFNNKHGPYYGSNAKWQNIIWNVHYPYNAVIEHSQFSRHKRNNTDDSSYTHQNYTYKYNEQGYPTKQIGHTTFMSFPVTSTVTYKYIAAH